MPTVNSRMAVIGAGPIGLEAALYGLACGFDVRVYEAGQVGENVRRWGHVTLFSPWSMNHSPLGARLIQRHRPSYEFPGDQDYLSGRELLERYLIPLSETSEFKGRIHERQRVVAIGRTGVQKKDLIGNSGRNQFPFRLLLKDAEGRESIATADIVIDVSGVYDNPRCLGLGGIPAVGEKGLKDEIVYHLDDVAGQSRGLYAGKTTLVVGDGYSAATTMASLAEVAASAPGTCLHWVSRHSRKEPITAIPSDPLPERVRLTSRANALVRTPSPFLHYYPETFVEAISYDQTRNIFEATLVSGKKSWTLKVNRVVANVGYEPDNSIYRELQVHECYATRGPIKLAAALLGEDSADCLAQSPHGAATLKNPEPGFFILGSKSYGTNSNFILKVGFDQIREIFADLMNRPDLNLYRTEDRASLV